MWQIMDKDFRGPIIWARSRRDFQVRERKRGGRRKISATDSQEKPYEDRQTCMKKPPENEEVGRLEPLEYRAESFLSLPLLLDICSTISQAGLKILVLLPGPPQC